MHSQSAEAVKQTQTEVAKLIAQIFEGLDRNKTKEEKDKDKKKPRSVEVQLGKNKALKAVEGQEPSKNTLTAEQATTLQSLMNTPTTEAGQDLDSSAQSLGRVVTVRVDKEPVLRIANGQLENKLAPELQKDIDEIESKAAQPEVQPETQSQKISEPETQEQEQEAVKTSPSSSSPSLPELPADFGVPEAKGITAEAVAATGDTLLMHSYGSLESTRQDLNDSYRRASAPGYEYIASVPHMAPLREQYDSYRDNFEVRLKNAIEQGTYKPPVQSTEKAAPEQTTSEQTASRQPEAKQPAPEPLEPLGHNQPLGQQEAMQPESLAAVAEPQAAEPQINIQPELEATSEAQQPAPEQAEPEPETESTIADTSQEVSAPSPEPSKQLVVAEQVQPKPERKGFGEALSKDVAASFKLKPETKQWLLETGTALKQGAAKAWDKFKNKSKEVATSGAKLIQSRQAADTATQLLNSDPQGRLFKGEDYTVTAVNRHTISVTDAEQKEILRFEETALGPKILKSDLTPKQIKEFAQVRGQLQKHGTEKPARDQTCGEDAIFARVRTVG